MTNTNDFRKYSYASDTSYMIDNFNLQRSSSQAAPKLYPEAEPYGRGFKVRENKKRKSRNQLKNEQKLAFGKSLVIVAVSIVCFLMLALVLNSFVIKNEMTKEIASMQYEISNAQSENISLQAQLDSMVSISMIDEYAVSKLGMTKVKSNQIQYMDVSEYKAQRAEKINKTSLTEATKELTDLNGNK